VLRDVRVGDLRLAVASKSVLNFVLVKNGIAISMDGKGAW
jgi:hypothetical protein